MKILDFNFNWARGALVGVRQAFLHDLDVPHTGGASIISSEVWEPVHLRLILGIANRLALSIPVGGYV